MNQKNTWLIAAFLFIAVLGQGLAAQESILNSYQRNFTRAELSAKAGILQDAAVDSRSSEFIGGLYEFAMNFALRNAELLQRDPNIITILTISARGTADAGYTASVNTIRQLFNVYRDTQSRIAVLGALGVLGKGNAQVINDLNQFLANQNNLFLSDLEINQDTFLACVSALGSLGDNSSFPVLFSTLIADYPDNIIAAVEKALGNLDGDFYPFIIDIVQRNPVREKLVAFRMGCLTDSFSRFSPVQRGTLAETALDIGLFLKPNTDADEAAASALMAGAAAVLGELKWSRAAPLLVKYFYRAQAEYQNGYISGEQFLEVVTILGVMGSAEAAQALALQLGYFNSQMERRGAFDEPLTLGVVNTLGEIGAKIAFDYLLYISYLSYPESIQAAARAALGQLKW
ncbi:hypothetical protein FACS189476_06400 [Spirochaetia bacterium]|nr:hypothetical protein FACS189476_06400 [Spirochaetia bacterium]